MCAKCCFTPKSEFSRSLKHLKTTLNFSEKNIGGCLVTSSKLFPTQASVIRNKKYLKNSSAKCCFTEKSEFSRTLGNFKMTLRNSEKIRWCTGTSSQLFRTQGFRYVLKNIFVKNFTAPYYIYLHVHCVRMKSSTQQKVSQLVQNC